MSSILSVLSYVRSPQSHVAPASAKHVAEAALAALPGLPETQLAKAPSPLDAPALAEAKRGMSVWQALKTLGTGWMVLTAVQRGCAVNAAALSQASARIARDATPVANNTLAAPCPRHPAGSIVQSLPQISSSQGLLQLDLSYQYGQDDNGFPKFCFVTSKNDLGPLLRVQPGDSLVLTLDNQVPSTDVTSLTMPALNMTLQNTPPCGGTVMDTSATNVHFHGMTVPPTCRADDVLGTVINSGDTFTYSFQVPSDASPGLYWYHPHIHGISEAALQGGAAGPIIIEGIEQVQPAVGGLAERVLVTRDIPIKLPENESTETNVPAWDVSVNYVPVTFPAYKPAVIEMNAGAREFWRVVNAGADTIMDFQVVYDGVPQTLQLVALDGYATRQESKSETTAQLINVTDVLVPPAGRAEFIVQAPGANVKNASFITLNVDTGPVGDNDPTRPLANIVLTSGGNGTQGNIPAAPATPVALPVNTLLNKSPDRMRSLAFSEVISNPSDPDSPTDFFITEAGKTPVMFDANAPASLVVVQDSVEDWIVENQATENHEFHQHQIHFKLLERNGQPVSLLEQQYLDTVNLPYWNGSGAYPSVKLRMDFRGRDVGEFVYHCHILGHEDNGMMAKIQVVPNNCTTSGAVENAVNRGVLAGIAMGTTLLGAWLF